MNFGIEQLDLHIYKAYSSNSHTFMQTPHQPCQQFNKTSVISKNMAEIQNQIKNKSVPNKSDSLVDLIMRFEKPTKETTQVDNESALPKINKGLSYLERKCSALFGFQCRLGQTRDLEKSSDLPIEIFTSGVIHDLLQDTTINPAVLESLVQFIQKTCHKDTKTYNFFTDRRIMADDVDSTTVTLWTLLNHKEGRISKQDALSVGRKILKNTTPAGVIETFFPPFLNRRGKLDCATLSNVLRVIYYLKLDSPQNDLPGVEPTEDFLLKSLKTGDCRFGNGLYYYESVDAFHYFLSNTLPLSTRAEGKFSDGLKTQVYKRFGANSNPIDIAMRIITAINLKLVEFDENVKHNIKKEVKVLIKLQNENGSWPADSMYRFKGWYFGCKTLSTAFAIRAIKLFVDNYGEL